MGKLIGVFCENLYKKIYYIIEIQMYVVIMFPSLCRLCSFN